MYQIQPFGVKRLSDGLNIPANPEIPSYREYLAWLEEGNTPTPYEAPVADVQAFFVNLIQSRLDAFARTRNYDGILSACTYATSSVPQFVAEGQHCVGLRDSTWLAAYGILAEVEAETRPVPTSMEDIEDDLPELVWPD